MTYLSGGLGRHVVILVEPEVISQKVNCLDDIRRLAHVPLKADSDIHSLAGFLA